MADEVDVDKVSSTTIKEEIRDSPEHTSSKENAEVQNPNPVVETSKDWKAWTEEETRYLLSLYKLFVVKYPEYTRKNLYQEISNAMAERGYHKDGERIRNRLKTLRTTYRRVVEYNSRHVIKKEYQYLDDMADICDASPSLSDDNSSVSGVPATDEEAADASSYSITEDGDTTRRLRLVRTKSPKSDYEYPATSKLKRSQPQEQPAKKNVAKKSFTPMFQCGLCSGKFTTSNQLHLHQCPNKPKARVNMEKPVLNNNHVKRKPLPPKMPATQNGKSSFQWTSMSTLKFLMLLKDCKMKPKNSNVHHNLLEAVADMMMKHGICVSPEDLEKKWRCLAGNYEKTVNYNKKHKDKKKCAFYNRLSELYRYGASLELFKSEEPVKMTVEVSPFTYSATEPRKSSRIQSRKMSNEQEKEGGQHNNNSSDLVKWLSMFWTEWKMMEQERKEAEAQRHMELMEVLSYIADGISGAR